MADGQVGGPGSETHGLLLTGLGRGFLQAVKCLGKGCWLSERFELP